MAPLALSKLKKKPVLENQTKPKAKTNRFNGLTEEEIQQNSPPLPDYLKMDLDLVFVGINPSLTAAYRGRYYAGPGNHFYKLLHESGLVSRFVSFEEDGQLLEFGIGLTNIVDRPTRSSADLSRAEIKEGSSIVEQKLQQYKPKVAVFNGRCIYDVFANKTAKSEFNFGLQPERIGETAVWVVPSSSARCSNFPRMIDKLQFYLSLKKYLSFVKGEIDNVDIKEFYFTREKKEHESSTSRMWRGKKASLFYSGGKIANKDTLNADISDEDIAFVSNEFVIKEIRSQEGIETLKKIESNSSKENDSKSIDEDSKGGNDSEKMHVRKRRIKENSRTNRDALRNSLTKSSDLRIKERENPSDFVSLIKQRLEAKKRKAEELESFPEN